MSTSVMKSTVVNCSGSFSNRVPNIITTHIDHMKLLFIWYFIIFFHILLVPFFIIVYIWLYLLCASV